MGRGFPSILVKHLMRRVRGYTTHLAQRNHDADRRRISASLTIHEGMKVWLAWEWLQIRQRTGFEA